MGGEGNLSPALVRSMIDGWRAKDHVAMDRSCSKLMRLAGILSRNGGSHIRSLKPLMNAFGLPGGRLRQPRLPIAAADVEQRVKDVLALDIPGLPPPLSPQPYP